MNDLLDRRLKKIDPKVKYQKVPYDEQNIHKAVHEANTPSSRSKKMWIMKTIPIPIVAVVACMWWCFQFTSYSTNTPLPTASMPEKSSVAELKTTATTHHVRSNTLIEDNLTFTQQKSSKMVRKTYVIHNDNHFVQTEERINPSKLGEVIGTVKNGRTSGKAPSSFSKAKIYSIKERNQEKLIAIQSHHDHDTGGESGSINEQGYFIFEKHRQLPASQ